MDLFSIISWSSLKSLVDFTDMDFIIAAVCMIMAPVIWNTIARLEYRTHFLTRLCGGRAKLAVYLLAVYIFSASSFRDYRFQLAMDAQSKLDVLGSWPVAACAVLLIALGMTFVLAAHWQLGILNTYLGDYFGILMKERVTAFPFNVLEHPMYDGASMNFLGAALWYRSPAGIVLAAFAFCVYRVACLAEGPFTGMIYREAAKAAQSVHGKPARKATRRAKPMHED